MEHTLDLPLTGPSNADSKEVVFFRILTTSRFVDDSTPGGAFPHNIGFTTSEENHRTSTGEARHIAPKHGHICACKLCLSSEMHLPFYVGDTHYFVDRTSKQQFNIIPAVLWPYLEIIRLDKPTGSLLMFWPFAWGLTMAAYRVQLSFDKYLTYLVQFAIYAVLLRGSACTVNDILDVKYDAAVERTRGRPLPSRRISMQAATIFLLFQYALSITFLTLVLPALGRIVALGQLLPVFAIYPLLKRVTYWPQAWLGIAMNLGFPVAWTTVTGSFDFQVVIPALLGCWCWTMLYDTIYACQDIRDDVKAGVRSTAILFGNWIYPLLVLSGMLFLKMLIVVGYLNGHGIAYYLITVGGTSVHLIMQCKTVDLADPKSCWRNFNHNGRLGCIIWVGLLVEYHPQIRYMASF